jgi:hypothetical protein
MKPTVYFVSMALLCCAGQTHADTLTPAARKELLQKADDWLVPQPNPDSKLIKIFVFRSGTDDFYALGFVAPGSPERALVGCAYREITDSHLTKDVPASGEVSLADVSPTSPFNDGQGTNFGLLTGIQLLRRGNEKLGAALIDKALAKDAGDPHSPFYSPAGEAPVLMLARSCLAAALSDISSDKPDFAKIKQRIERLLADQPRLKSDATDWLLAGLAANVAYKPAAEGSIERAIDDYLVGGGKQGALTFEMGEMAPAKKALVLKGFAAVPALLAQRHSKRFSNHLMQGFNNFSSYPMDAGQVINSYLQSLANDELGANWLDVQQGRTSADDAVLQWWKQASALGEKAYVKKYTVVLGEGKDATLSDELLLLAENRYPTFLAGFHTALLKTSCPSWPVLDAIAKSDAYSKQQKIEFAEEAIATNDEAHRNSAIDRLRKLDPALADAQLLKLLKQAPNMAAGEYWTDQDAGLGYFVSESVDAQVWLALDALLQRADLGMRMELIDHLLPPHDAPANILRSFQSIYDRYHDDATIRDIADSEKFSGPGAGYPHHRISMRDFVHEHWARWLKLDLTEPVENATADQWTTYRNAVGLALQKRNAEQSRPPE